MSVSFAIVIAFGQQNSLSACEESGIDTMFEDACVACPPTVGSDEKNPVQFPFKVSGRWEEEIKKMLAVDGDALKVKLQEIVKALVEKKVAHGTSTVDATVMLDTSCDLFSLAGSDYKKHILSVCEIGKFDVSPAVAMFAGIPQLVTSTDGHWTIVVLSPEEFEKVGADNACGVKSMGAAAVESGTGKVFEVLRGETLWILLGGLLYVYLCVSRQR